MMLKSLLLFIVGGLNLLIGLLVLSRDSKRLQNRLFFLFSFSLSGWVVGIGGFLLSNAAGIALYWARLYYIFPLLIAASMPLFAYSFPEGKTVPKTWTVPIVSGFALLSIIISVYPHLFLEHVVYFDWGKDVVLNKAFYLVYSIYLLACFGVGLLHTYRKSKRLQGLGSSQTYFFFVGFLLTSSFGVYFNLILPWFDNYRLIWLGPLFTNAFIIATGYSMIRHRMFNIRLIAARAVAYVTSLAVLAAIYGFVVFGIFKFVFQLNFSVSAQIYVSAATAIAAIGFTTLKNFFDRITNRLFYRDAYDTQELLDSLNRLFVAHTDLERLLKQSALILEQSLKADFCYFGIRESDETPQRVIGHVNKRIRPEDIELVRQLTPHMHRKVIVTDELDSKYSELAQVLQANDIAVLGRLTTTTSRTVEGLGYLVLGPRRSGNPYTSQDLRLLEIIINELVIAIENSLRLEQIEHFNQTLQANVDDATRKLRRTNEKLQGLDATKDEFITMASHQLRTPLTSVKGYLSMVLEGDAGKLNAQQTQLLTQSYVSAQRMVFLIADLLNLSRLNTGKFLIESTPTDLAQIVEEEVSQLAETAKARDISLSYTRPETFPSLMLDETKIRQVVMNFIDNAIYYTPAGGSIAVSLTETQSSIEYKVIDTGIGVPRAEQRHLFSKFYRAENAKRARPDGTGLGLFMAKKVIAAQGGAVVFESEEGKGSSFGFRFSKAYHLAPVAKEAK